MKVSIFWGICSIILILILICIGYSWRFRILQENYDPIKSTPYPFVVEKYNRNDEKYIESKVKVDAGTNYINENIQTVDNQGHFSINNDNLVIHNQVSQTCLDPATYDPTKKSCVCPDGFNYSNVVGCLPICEYWQKYTTDGMGGGVCQDICSDPNQYFNSELTTLTSQNSCSYCPYGYQTNQINMCVPLNDCPTGKKYIDNTGICKSYNVCSYFQVDNSHGQNMDCSKLKCPIKTQFFDVNTQTCKDCPNGYSVNDKNICILNNECPDGYHLGPHATCVPSCTAWWEQWDTAQQACTNKCTGTDAHGYLNQYAVITVNSGDSKKDKVTGFENDTCSIKDITGIDVEGGIIGSSGGGITFTGDGVGYGGINDKNTYTCSTCPAPMISDGSNGCMMGPTPPAPTCEPGYEMINGVCSLPCSNWRKYDVKTDSCILRCLDTTQFWQTNPNGAGECLTCKSIGKDGYKVDANNECTVKIPIAPILNTPVPSCAPGFYSYIDPDTEQSKCKSKCTDFTTQNSKDPEVCDPICTAENTYYDSSKPVGSQCIKCGYGYLVDRETNICSECDYKVQYLGAYAPGTQSYKNIASNDNNPKNFLGYHCEPQCDIGCVKDDILTSPTYNTCYLCDSKAYPDKFIQKYTRNTSSGLCTANCVSPNMLDPDKANNDPNPCSKCIDGYTNTTNTASSNNPDGWGISKGQIGKCVPSTCPVGFKIGSDYTCSECANDYTDKVSECKTLGVGVNASSTPVTKNGQKVCFPRNCPDGSALGTDYTCSACPRGQEGSVATGCQPPSSDIKIVSVANLIPGNVTTNAEYTQVDVDYFYLDITLSVKDINIGFVKVSLGSDSQTTSSDENMTFTSVKLNTPGIPLTVEYYATKADANTSKNLVSKDEYTISVKQKYMENQTSIVCGPEVFAAAYSIIPAGKVNNANNTFIPGKVTGGDSGGGGYECVDCKDGVPGAPACPPGVLVSKNHASKGCRFGSQPANSANCVC
jgi:hypothetical protein